MMEKGSLRAGTILVMDDDETMHFILERAFAELGYTTESVVNGREAISRHQQRLSEGRPFSAVVLDLNIPGGMGGREVVRVLRESEPGVRAFVASGASEDPAVVEYGRFGFSGVILKPCVYREMLAELRRVFGGSRATS